MKQTKDRILFLAIGCLLGVAFVLSFHGMRLVYETLFAEYIVTTPQGIEERIAKRLPNNAYDIRHVVRPTFPDSADWLAFSAYPEEMNKYVETFITEKRQYETVEESAAIIPSFAYMKDKIGWYSSRPSTLRTYKGEFFRLVHDTALNRAYIHTFDM